MTQRLRWPKALHLLVALASLTLGLMLLLAGLTVQQIAMVTGIGIVAAGITLVLRGFGIDADGEGTDGEDRGGDARSAASTARVWIVRLAALALIVIGALMALWPDAGAPWLAAGVALALILHGIVSGIEAIRGGADRRTSGALIALAGIALGVLSFSWPVLTLVIFRLAIAAWLLFLGVHALFALWRGRGAKAKNTAETHDPRPASKIANWSRTIASALALVLAVGAAYGSAQLLGGTPLPAPDAFYTAPNEVPSQRGQLIRTEPLTVGVPAGAQAWKMLYTTTRPDGSPAISSGTILAPAKRGGDPLPLLTVSHGTTGIVNGCAPSLSAAPFADGAGTAMQEMVTKHGWVAVTSDYTGMGTEGTAEYLVGEAEARNVLDASLAARQFAELSLTTDTVVWGHSQGGQGALWTAQLAEEYAPELSVLGVAAFAPAANLFGLAEANKSNAGGKTVSAYIAKTWNEAFPELELEQHLTPGSKKPVDRISQLCFNGNDAISAILRGTQVPNQIFPDSMLQGEFGDLLKQQSPTGPFAGPVLVAQGLADPLVLPKLQQQWVDDRCDAGIAIDYRTFEGLSHVSLVAADSPLTPQIVQWTLDRWSGKAAPTECTTKTYPQKQS
mgnify:CR=1 FL=1